jgi:acyl-CoA thioester hydrolase
MSGRFAYGLRVRYHETDPQGHVFNSRYLEYTDVALTEWIRSLGMPYSQFVAEGCDPTVVRTEIEYRAAAMFDDDLRIEVDLVDVGRSSFTLDFEIKRDEDDLIASARIVYVNLDPTTKRSRPIPARLVDRLRASSEDRRANEIVGGR